MSEVTFRDFAAAAMRGDEPAGAAVLETLLGLPGPAAAAATSHFRTQVTSGGPAFMGKAMGLRTAVTSGSEDEVRTLLADCFGLVDPALAEAVAKLRTRYPRT
ncbi:MAG: hypothetical protein SFX73_40825 [Kofleriaceae bacterium]|nr:hypothetical protein [Kofleriaceae bacterium]